MQVLVTGAAGFIGSHVCDLLLNEGHQVIALDDLSTGNERNLSAFASHPHFRFVRADIRERETIKPYFAGVDWVIHLAGRSDIVPSIEQPEDYFDVNVSGTLNVLQAAKQHGVKSWCTPLPHPAMAFPTFIRHPKTRRSSQSIRMR